MTFRKGIKISLTGTVIEAAGLGLDILHHLNIGIKTPEGLITGNHLTIFVGFLINLVGILVILASSRKK